MNKKSIKKDKQNFYCEFCDYSTSIKCNYDRHIITPKHKMNKYNNKTENYKFLCDCGKKYKYQSGLSSHKKKCKIIQIKNVQIENNKSDPIGNVENVKMQRYGEQLNKERKNSVNMQQMDYTSEISSVLKDTIDSGASVTALPSRDIPQATLPIQNDAEVKQNYIKKNIIFT